jgi:hypothetical protein
MSAISKHAALGCALLGAALVPRWISDGPARGTDRCRSPEQVRATSLIPGTTPLGERLEALDERTFQWSEGEVATPLTPAPMSFQIVRSYDGPLLYMWATRIGSDALVRASAGSRAPTEEERSRLRLQPEALTQREVEAGAAVLPVHIAWDHTQPGVSRLVAWYFVFDGAPVASPFLAQLARAPGLALRGARPLTLVSVAALAPRPRAAAVEDAAVAWLANAWLFLDSACAPR